MIDSKRLIAFVFGIVGAVCCAVLAGYIFIAYILASALALGAFVPFLVPIFSLIAVIVLNSIGASFCFKKPKIGGILFSISLALIVGTSIYFFAQDGISIGLVIDLIALPVIPALVLAFIASKSYWGQQLNTQPALASANTQVETQTTVANKQEEIQTKAETQINNTSSNKKSKR